MANVSKRPTMCSDDEMPRWGRIGMRLTHVCWRPCFCVVHFDSDVLVRSDSLCVVVCFVNRVSGHVGFNWMFGQLSFRLRPCLRDS